MPRSNFFVNDFRDSIRRRWEDFAKMIPRPSSTYSDNAVDEVPKVSNEKSPFN